MKQNTFAFVFPIDGDCLNARDGVVKGNTLCLSVALRAEGGRRLLVNGQPVTEAENRNYRCTVTLQAGKNTLTASDAESGEEMAIEVYYFANAVGKYRICSDDNLRFLQELHEHPESYPSAFDHPYLAIYKQAHDKYGATVQLNLFYATDEKSLSHFSRPRAYFDLSMMTDRYREDFCANADWFSFSFHANAEYPGKPYQFEKGEVIRAHCERMHREIARFAGEECISGSVTVHWGEASEECIAVLRMLGYRSFMGYLSIPSRGSRWLPTMPRMR